MSDPVRDYLNQCGRVPLLTGAEEIELGHAVQAMIRLTSSDRGDFTPAERRTIKRGERAKKRMIEANLRLVVTVAKKYKSWTSSLDLLDLIQEGNIGLVRAVELFDPERGYKFSTYSFWWIRQGITRATLTSDRLIRLPAAAAEAIRKLRYWKGDFEVKHGRPPTVIECADHIGCKESTMRQYMLHPTDCFSLDYRVSDGGKEASAIVDLIADTKYEPDAEAELAALRAEIAIQNLEGQQKTIVELRYGLNGEEPMSYQNIADRLGLTRDKVQKTEKRALCRMRLLMTTPPGKPSPQKKSSSSNWSWAQAGYELP